MSSSTLGQRDPKIAIDNNPESDYEGRVYVVWNDAGDNTWRRIVFRYSTNRGSTWSQEIVISERQTDEASLDVVSTYIDGKVDDVQAALVRYPDIAVSSNGDVYVAWYEHDRQGVFTGRISIRRSTNGGGTFSPAVVIVDPVGFEVSCVGNFARPKIRPSLAVSANGSVFMITCDVKSLVDPDPYLRMFRSTDNGASWTETWNLLSPSGQQDFFPQVVVTPDEHVHVTYMHTTALDPCSFDPNITASWTITSYDNGTTFRTPRQVSNSFSTNSGHMLYFDAGAAPSRFDDAVFSVWTDHRNGYLETYFARVNPPPAPPKGITIEATPPNEYGYSYPLIRWAPNTETDLAGYQLWRMTTGFACGTSSWSVLADNLPANQTEYTDLSIGTVMPGGDCTAKYALKARDNAGNYSDTSRNVQINYASYMWKIEGKGQQLPKSFALHAAYPNPFNPLTQIQFDLSENGFVSLDVFDVLGGKIENLVNGYREANYYRVIWDASQHASGIYIVRLSVTGESGRQPFTKTIKLVLAK